MRSPFVTALKWSFVAALIVFIGLTISVGGPLNLLTGMALIGAVISSTTTAILVFLVVIIYLAVRGYRGTLPGDKD